MYRGGSRIRPKKIRKMPSGWYRYKNLLFQRSSTLGERGAHSNGKTHRCFGQWSLTARQLLHGAKGGQTANTHPESAFGWVLIGWALGRLLRETRKGALHKVSVRDVQGRGQRYSDVWAPDIPGMSPDLLFLAVLDFLASSAQGNPCSFERFLASFPRILGVRPRERILADFVGFSLFFLNGKEKKIRVLPKHFIFWLFFFPSWHL